MNLIGNLCINTVVSVLFFASFFLCAFFTILFFITKMQKSVLLILTANIVQLVAVFIMLYSLRYGHLPLLIITDILVTLVVYLWILAVFEILSIANDNKFFYTVILISILSTITLYSFTKSIRTVNLIKSFSSAAILFYGAFKALKERNKHNKHQIYYTVTTLTLVGAFASARTLFRSINPAEYSGAMELHPSVSLVIIITFSAAFIMNFTLLYLTYENLVLKIEELSHYDPLTKVLSRSTFFLMMEQKLSEIKRNSRKITAAILDIDDFKKINDTYGHQAGDKVLAGYAKTLKDCLREKDIIGRIGGEEFMMVLEVHDEDEGIKVLNRIKDKAVSTSFLKNESISFSCGQMFIDKDLSDMPMEEIIKIVDKKMYEAKATGKNKII